MKIRSSLSGLIPFVSVAAYAQLIFSAGQGQPNSFDQIRVSEDYFGWPDPDTLSVQGNRNRNCERFGCTTLQHKAPKPAVNEHWKARKIPRKNDEFLRGV